MRYLVKIHSLSTLSLWLKSNENEVKYTDLRRKIEIKKKSNLMTNEKI